MVAAEMTPQDAVDGVHALAAMIGTLTAMQAATAARVIAHAVAAAHPSAGALELAAPTDGTTPRQLAWIGRQGHVHDLDLDALGPDVAAMADYLNLTHLQRLPGVRVVLGADRVPRTRVDLHAVLASPAAPPTIAELVIVRDPDGPVSADLVIGEVRPGRGLRVRTTVVDAGAGWAWNDWVAHRDDALEHASPAARGHVLAAFDNPPGGRYITGRDDQDWLDGPATKESTP